jgi:hypothetical protein
MSDSEPEGGVTKFNGKKAKVKEEIVEWRARAKEKRT